MRLNERCCESLVEETETTSRMLDITVEKGNVLSSIVALHAN